MITGTSARAELERAVKALETAVEALHRAAATLGGPLRPACEFARADADDSRRRAQRILAQAPKE